ncbi:MAG TPA: MFS transporter [Terricaulis sp.]|nr:MFS transporter [Terricaulis sp.]
MTGQALNEVGEWRRGWRVAGAAFVGMGVGAGLFQYVSSLFITPLEDAFGWSRGEIAGAAAIGLFGALSAPIIGMIADRVGAMRVAIVCLLLVALAYVGLASMTGELWQFMACVTLLALAAPGSASLVFSRAVNGWFDQSRGLALGVMASGLSVATFALSPVLSDIIADHGFRAGYLTLAAITGIIGVIVVLAGIRSGPIGSRASVDSDAPPEGVTLRGAARMPSFWTLALIMLIVNAASTGVLTQIAPLLASKGLTGEPVAMLVSIYALSVFAGRLSIGWLFDRTEAKWIAALVTAAAMAGFLLLLNAAPTLVFAAACVVLIGLMQGAEGDVLAYFVSRLFGLRAYNTIYGVFFTISIMGSALGIFGYGRLYDLTQNYNQALMLSGGALAAAVALYICMPRVRPAEEAQISA